MACEANKADCFNKYSKCELNKEGNCAWKQCSKLKICINSLNCMVRGCNQEICSNADDEIPAMVCPLTPVATLWTQCLDKHRLRPPRCLAGRDGRCKWTRGSGKFWLCMKGQLCNWKYDAKTGMKKKAHHHKKK